MQKYVNVNEISKDDLQIYDVFLRSRENTGRKLRSADGELRDVFNRTKIDMSTHLLALVNMSKLSRVKLVANRSENVEVLLRILGQLAKYWNDRIRTEDIQIVVEENGDILATYILEETLDFDILSQLTPRRVKVYDKEDDDDGTEEEDKE